MTTPPRRQPSVKSFLLAAAAGSALLLCMAATVGGYLRIDSSGWSSQIPIFQALSAHAMYANSIQAYSGEMVTVSGLTVANGKIAATGILASETPADGDLLYYHSGGWRKVAIGTEGKILVVDNTTPTWEEDITVATISTDTINATSVTADSFFGQAGTYDADDDGKIDVSAGGTGIDSSSLSGPAYVTAGVWMILDAATGTAGQVPSLQGDGTLTWTTAGGGAGTISAPVVYTSDHAVSSAEAIFGVSLSNYGAVTAVTFRLPPAADGRIVTVVQAAPVLQGASCYDAMTAAYKFNSLSSLTTDSIGANTLTNNNAVTACTGKSGGGAEFEKDASQYLSVATSYPPLERSSYSVSFWVNHETVGTMDYLFKDDSSGGYNCYIYRTAGGNLTFDCYDGTNTPRVSYSWTPDAATWYHVVGTIDARAMMRLYVNGSLVGSANDTSNLYGRVQAGPLQIGWRESTQHFDGVLDEIYVFDRALTATEVSELYLSGTGTYLLNSTLTIEPDGTDRIQGLTDTDGDGIRARNYSTITLVGDTANAAWLPVSSSGDWTDSN